MNWKLTQNADDSDSKRAEAIEFLEQMETRHNQVLDELDLLNDRIQKVLDEYLLSRKSTSSSDEPSNGAAEPSLDSVQGKKSA